MKSDDKAARVPGAGAREKVWRPPTRRAFVAMLGAAAAALALREQQAKDDPPRSPRTGTTRWIGHC
jgi:hypothetical protein